MRIITENALKNFADKNPQAKPAIESFTRTLRGGDWKNLLEVRTVFPHADQIITRSGRPAVVFNVGGNNWRVIAAMHYNHKTAFILAILTHAEYSREKWKETL